MNRPEANDYYAQMGDLSVSRRWNAPWVPKKGSRRFFHNFESPHRQKRDKIRVMANY